MSHDEQQAHEPRTESPVEPDGRSLTTELAIISTAWILGALFVGIAFVAFSDVFAGLVA